jgi:hypothetical protein
MGIRLTRAAPGWDPMRTLHSRWHFDRRRVTDSPCIATFKGFLPSSPLPTVHPFQIGNGLLSKFRAGLTAPEFSTYMDSIAGVAVDAWGMAYNHRSRSDRRARSQLRKPTSPRSIRRPPLFR